MDKRIIPIALAAGFLAITACNVTAQKTEVEAPKPDTTKAEAPTDTTDSIKPLAEAPKDTATEALPTSDNPILAQATKDAAALAKTHHSTNTGVGQRSRSASDPSGFVMITDVIPDVVLEPRYYTTYNFVGSRIDGYEEPVALCTREAAAALKKVADALRPKGYVIKIYDAYRPQKAVNHFCRWARTADTKMKADFYPDLGKSSLFPTYVATHSGHTKGSTFDLTIADAKTGRDIDMGGTFDFFGPRSHYAYGNITAEQAQNRRVLHDAMVRQGFKPYSNEWWHFTLRNEPYPNTYFTFPVNSHVVK